MTLILTQIELKTGTRATRGAQVQEPDRAYLNLPSAGPLAVGAVPLLRLLTTDTGAYLCFNCPCQ